MIRESEVREKLEDLLSDEFCLEDFEDWLVQRSWNMHLDSSSAAQDLVSAIELALSEHSSGHLSDEQLRADLQSLLDRVTAPARVAAP